MSITMKALLITALGGTTGIVGWAAMTREAEPAAEVGSASAIEPQAPLASAGESEPQASDVAARGTVEPRAQWQERRRSIRSRLPQRATGEGAAAGERTAAPSPEDARLHAAYQEFQRMVDACMEDLGAESVGSVSLSMHEIGAPGVGTIYESVEVVDASFDEPEVIECLTQSMYAFVGEAPAEAYERVIGITAPLGKAQASDEKDAQVFGGIVGAHMGEVRFCESKAEGAVTGEVTVAITLGESGKPESSVAGTSTLPTAVVECIVGATKRWQFPTKMAGKRFERAFVLPVPGTPPGPVGKR